APNDKGAVGNLCYRFEGDVEDPSILFYHFLESLLWSKNKYLVFLIENNIGEFIIIFKILKYNF
ncbi:hypothetical protein ACJX0J_010755, partial [Zea mays]